MRTIEITSRRNGFFDVAPVCIIVVDGENIGTIIPGKTISFELDGSPHTIQCKYEYGKYNVEKSNVIHINDLKNHNIVLAAISNTYMKRFKENIRTFFSKGYINVPDIELYEV